MTAESVQRVASLFDGALRMQDRAALRLAANRFEEADRSYRAASRLQREAFAALCLELSPRELGRVVVLDSRRPQRKRARLNRQFQPVEPISPDFAALERGAR